MDKPIDEGRRNFLKLAGKTGLVALVAGMGFNCKKETPSPSTFYIEVRDHMTNNPINTIEKEGITNSDNGFVISYGELVNNSPDYENNFFVVREPGFGKVLGRSLGSPSVGVNTTDVTGLVAYVLQKNDKAKYPEVLKDVSGGLVVPRNAVWNRVDKDGQDGPSSVWDDRDVYINDFLGYTGSIKPGGNDFSNGYGDCAIDGVPQDGAHDILNLWIGVNNRYSIYSLNRRAINETGEFLTRSDNKVDFNYPAGRHALRAYMCFAE